MTSYKATAEQWHRRQHNWGRGAGASMEDCWFCQRGRAVCKSKRPYGDRESATEAARDLNIKEAWARPTYPYPCRYCPGYHLATAKDARKKKRVERQRRKWLIAQLAP